jgi:hypothetical protein
MTINLFKQLNYIYCKLLIIFFSIPGFSCKNIQEQTHVSIPVFSKDIAPIIYKNCTPCHRPGSGAPFNLVNYEDVKRHLHTLQLSINERLMPPWPADTSYSRFKDEKVMTQNEINLFNKWVENGAPIGEKAAIPKPPTNYNQSIFGKPDMVVSMDTFFIPGNNKDNFIMLKIPYELPADTFIKAIEIIPGNKKLVHHINAHLVQYEIQSKKNFNSGVEFVDTEIHDKANAYKLLSLQNDDGTYPLLTPSVSNYLPGVETAFYPDNIGGYSVKRKGVILLDNIHYGPSPVDTYDVSSFNIFFNPEPPKRPVKEMILGTSGISPVVPPLIIPPNQRKTFTTSFVVPQTISLLTINPHMHLLGVSFLAYVILPNGDTIPLIRIPKWDFRWQYFYTFQSILKISAGSKIVAEGIYDNTENNPLNPYHPPQIISEREGSMRTTDEMFQLICTYIPYQDGDEKINLETKKK